MLTDVYFALPGTRILGIEGKKGEGRMEGTQARHQQQQQQGETKGKNTQHNTITAIVLAAGYGTRLERDIKADTTGKYKELLGVPKALIPVAGKPLIEYWIEIFNDNNKVQLGGDGCIIKDIHIVCTARHYDQFVAWAKGIDFPIENIFNDGTTSNETRRGALGDLHHFLKERHIEGSIVVVAGDTLLKRDFRLDSMLDRFFALIEKHSGGSDKSHDDGVVALIPYYELKDHSEVQKRGIIEITSSSSTSSTSEEEGEGRVVRFLEKPSPESTTSNKACPPLYLYSARCKDEYLPLYVSQFSENLERIDAPGNFVAWLHSIAPVYAARVSGRFDIGNLADLEEANRLYLQQQED